MDKFPPYQVRMRNLTKAITANTMVNGSDVGALMQAFVELLLGRITDVDSDTIVTWAVVVNFIQLAKSFDASLPLSSVPIALSEASFYDTCRLSKREARVFGVYVWAAHSQRRMTPDFWSAFFDRYDKARARYNDDTLVRYVVFGGIALHLHDDTWLMPCTSKRIIDRVPEAMHLASRMHIKHARNADRLITKQHWRMMEKGVRAYILAQRNTIHGF